MLQRAIIDLHCDLLGCIQHNKGKYNFDSPELNCSLPQLIEGNVKLQVLAIAAITQKGSSRVGQEQIDLYPHLLKKNMLLLFQPSKLTPLAHTFFLLSKMPLPSLKKMSLSIFFSLAWPMPDPLKKSSTLASPGTKKIALEGATSPILASKKMAKHFSNTSTTKISPSILAIHLTSWPMTSSITSKKKDLIFL